MLQLKEKNVRSVFWRHKLHSFQLKLGIFRSIFSLDVPLKSVTETQNYRHHLLADQFGMHFKAACPLELQRSGRYDCSFISFPPCPFQVSHFWKENDINISLITGILKSTCYIDVRWFPFDVQKCDLKFGSWTHSGWLLDLQMLEADISNYISNGEWDLVGMLAFFNVFNEFKQCFPNLS